MVNNESQSALWQKLASFEIDERGASFTFEDRLARESGWSRAYTRRVTAEYRKFLFLCAVAGHPCTPSEPVDEAWHLHMIYTRSYWERLTPLLPCPLHHAPSKGGPRERAKFDDWYARTLDAYRRHFGEEPPRDIWPPAGPALPNPIRRVDLRENFVIPRRSLRRAGIGAAVASLALLTTGGWSSMAANVQVTSALVAIGGVLFVGGVIAYVLRDSKGTGSGCGSHGCSGHPEGASDSGGDCGGSDGGGCGGGCGGD